MAAFPNPLRRDRERRGFIVGQVAWRLGVTRRKADPRAAGGAEPWGTDEAEVRRGAARPGPRIAGAGGGGSFDSGNRLTKARRDAPFAVETSRQNRQAEDRRSDPRRSPHACGPDSGQGGIFQFHDEFAPVAVEFLAR